MRRLFFLSCFLVSVAVLGLGIFEKRASIEAWAANAACNIENCQEQGGSTWSIGSAGTLNILSGGSFQFAGTTINSTAAELDDTLLQIVIPDISAASTYWAVSHFSGTVTDWYCVLGDAITGTGSILTLGINGQEVTPNGTLTVTIIGSAGGVVDSSLGLTGNTTISAGQTISIATDGGSTGDIHESCTIVIAR